MRDRFSSEKLPLLYRGGRRYNLTESTTRDLDMGELIDLIGIDAFRSISLAYSHTGVGDGALREAIATLVQIPADQIVTTQGSAFGLYLIAAELGWPGAKVVMHAPYFQLTYNGFRAFDWDIAVVQNRFDDGYRLNVEAIEDQLDADTRLVSIATPQNPSGVSFSLDEIQILLDIMRKKAPDALLFVDETYREAAYSAQAVVKSAASLGQNVIACGSVSKAYGAPGLRVGWLTVPDRRLREKIIAAKENIVICDSILTETLAATLLEHREIVLEKQRQHLARPLAIVRAWQQAEHKFVDWVEPDAGALCCMRLNRDRIKSADLDRFWQALADLDTLVRPGLKFGSDLRHFRLGFGHISISDLEVGLENISRALRQASTGG